VWLCYLMLSVININIGKQLAQVDMCQTRLQLCRKGPVPVVTVTVFITILQYTLPCSLLE
jgi:hypothetical protein